VVFALLLGGALLTTFYMFRLFFLVFHGSYRGGAHPHESPATMTIPLIMLAVLSVVGGVLNVPHLLGGHEAMKHFLSTAAPAMGASSLHLERSRGMDAHGHHHGTGARHSGPDLPPLRHRSNSWMAIEASMPMPKRLLAERWRIDELYAWAFETSIRLVEHDNSTPWVKSA
jgi:NADH:ubiquinone oxidoreductase subunit 5 (subunit L)/multisubunit Na+/H+ antiporter MnhA subunit